MGHIGKLSRGLKWWKYNRDLDGVLKPEISEDADKMLDVDYYLDYCKDKVKDEVDLQLMRHFLLTKAKGGRRSKLMKDVKKKLIDGDFKNPEKKVEKEKKAEDKAKAGAQ